ncbi:pseudoazurin [Methylobacterium sp. J-026]|uniref:pseudoazurin n=1 Tax=Methylobacterium sp. J-026 TaxID=2836624 RepID=UPI001FB8749B|nr:pseudoazurin [Methylobacterium sp. J-026]MCJ2137868.1 pseudoazurin [Methylobacterium sp. J-026]
MIRKTVSAAVLAFAAATAVHATEVSIKTLNSGPGGMMVFDQAFVKIQPGDTVRFVPADKGHNAELIRGMAPEGAPTFKTVVGKEETVTFEKPGLYGFKCSPHYIMGMVGLIEVGDRPENLETAKAAQHGKLAAKRFEPLFEQVR